MAITIGQLLLAQRERLRDRRDRCVSEAQALQARIDAIHEELATLTQADEERFARWQAMVSIMVEGMK